MNNNFLDDIIIIIFSIDRKESLFRAYCDFQLHDIIRFNAENDRYTETVVVGRVKINSINLNTSLKPD